MGAYLVNFVPGVCENDPQNATMTVRYKMPKQKLSIQITLNGIVCLDEIVQSLGVFRIVVHRWSVYLPDRSDDHQ